MADQIENQQLELSAEELREFTNWPEPLIEEFLALIAGVVEISQTINIIVEENSINLSSISMVQSRLKSLAGEVHNLENSTSQKQKSEIGKIEGQIGAIQNELTARQKTGFKNLENKIHDLQNEFSGKQKTGFRNLESQIQALQNEASGQIKTGLNKLASQLLALENANSLDRIDPQGRMNAKNIGELFNLFAGLLAQLMQERAQRLRLERDLPAQVMARVMLNT